jgi:hypothetical protein
MLCWSGFNAGHYLLANRYKAMAENIPRFLKGEKPVKQTSCATVRKWLLITANTVAGMMQGVNLILLRSELNYGKDPKLLIHVSFFGSS